MQRFVVDDDRILVSADTTRAIGSKRGSRIKRTAFSIFTPTSWIGNRHLRQVFHGVPSEDMRKILGGNAAALYGFELDKLARYAKAHCPTIEELDQPLTALPEHPNEALLKAARGTML